MAHPVVEEAIESSTNTAGTSHVVTLPTAVAGHLLVIILGKGSTSATINAHGSLTELIDEASANGGYVAYRWMDGTEPASYTLTSSANTRSARIAYRISGAMNPAVTPPQIGTVATGTSATPDPPASATPPSSKDYLFIAFAHMAGEEADDDTWGNTPPTNYTPSPPRQKSCGTAGTNLGGLILAAERALTTGSAENPGTFGVDVSAAWRANTITIHPANPQTVTPTAFSLTFTGAAPTVTVTNNVTVTPSAFSLAFTGAAPTVSTPVVVTPSAFSLAFTGAAPSVVHGTVVTPSAFSLAFTGAVPDVIVEGGGITVTPDAFSLAFTGAVPTVTATDHKTVTPGAFSLAWTGAEPTVTVAANIVVTPDAFSLTWVGAQAIVTRTGPFKPGIGGGYIRS